MKFKSLISIGAAAAMAAASAVSANAALAVASEPVDGLVSGTQSWMRKLYVPSENIDCGIDCTKIGSVTFTISALEPDFFEGMTGGAVVVSCGPVSVCPSDHNWIQQNYWGVVDDELELDTHDASNPIQAVKVGDYTYELTCIIDETNCIYPEVIASPDGYVQIAIMEWGSDMSDIVVDSMELKDASGATIAKFDGNGAMIAGGASAPVEEEVVVAPAEEEKPAAGNVDAATDTSKGSPDTGVADVAVVAGLAIVAAGAVIVSKKRK